MMDRDEGASGAEDAKPSAAAAGEPGFTPSVPGGSAQVAAAVSPHYTPQTTLPTAMRTGARRQLPPVSFAHQGSGGSTGSNSSATPTAATPRTAPYTPMSGGGFRAPVTPGSAPPGFGVRRGGGGGSARKYKDKLKLQGFTPKPTVEAPPSQPPLDQVLDSGLGVMLYGDQEVSCTEKDVEDLAELGHGAFGCVRQMRHKQLGVTFAVKQIRDTIDPLARRQLLTDLEVIKRSSCPYIVRYFGFHVTEGDIWIFMEEMRYSLDKLIDRLRESELRFPEPALGKIVFSILSALDYLKSEHGVMHRDVKPSNILFGFDGSVKLCDFGIAKVMENSLAKTMVGCEKYLPPERLDPDTAKEPFDVRSDVWAFGLTMIELAQLEYPYPNENMFQRFTAIVENDPPSLKGSGYSDEFVDFVAQCLQKKKAHRPKYDQPPEEGERKEALRDHKFIQQHRDSTYDLAAWYASLGI